MSNSSIKKMFFECSVLCLIFFSLLLPQGYAEVGVSENLIKVGSSMDLSGPSVFYGKGYSKGINTYFKYINDKGGVHGRKLEFIVYDDKYEPSRTVSNFKRLVYDDKVFCLLETYGTPSTLAIMPLCETEKIPLLAPSTSAIQVAEPPKRYIFPVWPLLHYYGRIMIDYAVKDSGSKSPRVAFIYYDTELGTQQLEGAKDQAKRYGFEILEAVPYKGTTVDFTSLLLRIKSFNPDYLFAASIVKDTAAILQKIKEMGWDNVQVIGMTASVNQSMLNLAGDAVHFGKGYKAFYAGNLSHENLPGSEDYRTVMKKYYPDETPDEISFHAYGAARLLVEGLNRAGKDLTREKLIEAMESLKNYSDGFNGPVTYGKNERSGTSALRLLKVKEDGKFYGLTDWIYPKFTGHD